MKYFIKNLIKKQIKSNLKKLPVFVFSILLFLIVPVMAQQYYDPYYEPDKETKAQVVIFNVPVPTSTSFQSNFGLEQKYSTNNWLGVRGLFDDHSHTSSCNSSWRMDYPIKPSYVYDIGFASPSDRHHFFRDEEDDLDDIDTFIPFLRVNEFDPFNAPQYTHCFPQPKLQDFNFTPHNDIYSCDGVKTYKFSQHESYPQELILDQSNTYYDTYSSYPVQYNEDDTLVFFALGNDVNQVTIPNSVYRTMHQFEDFNINVVNVAPNKVYRVKGVGAFRFSADPCLFTNYSKY